VANPNSPFGFRPRWLAPKGKHYWCGTRDQADVWMIPWPTANRDHPTMKLMELSACGPTSPTQTSNRSSNQPAVECGIPPAGRGLRPTPQPAPAPAVAWQRRPWGQVDPWSGAEPRHRDRSSASGGSCSHRPRHFSEFAHRMPDTSGPPPSDVHRPPGRTHKKPRLRADSHFLQAAFSSAKLSKYQFGWQIVKASTNNDFTCCEAGGFPTLTICPESPPPLLTGISAGPSLHGLPRFAHGRLRHARCAGGRVRLQPRQENLEVHVFRTAHSSRGRRRSSGGTTGTWNVTWSWREIRHAFAFGAGSHPRSMSSGDPTQVPAPVTKNLSNRENRYPFSKWQERPNE